MLCGTASSAAYVLQQKKKDSLFFCLFMCQYQ
jgi:hypothetical protein